MIKNIIFIHIFRKLCVDNPFLSTFSVDKGDIRICCMNL